ncbi:MAG: hypothetical protein Q7R40_10680 [Phaeospirillum sp.]|nr:hypothetical protein [Phaeospirillum sp.]
MSRLAIPVLACGFLLIASPAELEELPDSAVAARQEGIEKFQQWRETIPDLEQRQYERVKRIGTGVLWNTRALVALGVLQVITLFILIRVLGQLASLKKISFIRSAAIEPISDSQPDATSPSHMPCQWKGLSKTTINNILLVVTSVSIGIGAIELGLRLAYLDQPWSGRNFAVDPVNQALTNAGIIHDPLVGYIAAPGIRSGTTYNHGDEGIRLNRQPKSDDDNRIRQGGILAVGDSFVYGSEVSDDQSWPAHLERLTGLPVINGAAGGYGFDQAYLRMESLIAAVKPKILILGCIPNCIQRNELRLNAGLVKPYFKAENGTLRLMNSPVRPYAPQIRHVGVWRYVFGHLYTAYWLADRLRLRTQWLVYEHEYQYADTPDGPEVTCLLMERFAGLARQYDAKPIVLMEYSGPQALGMDTSRQSTKVPYVLKCAAQNGVAVVDSYAYLREQYQQSAQVFWEHWVKQPYDTISHTGHMSGPGNLAMAKLLAEVIGKPTAPGKLP